MFKYQYSSLSLQIFLVLSLIFCFAHVNALSADERQTINELRSLNLEQLLEVEVILDDTFDIFSSLVENRKIALATGKEESLTLAPAVTSVITAMDIEATGANSLVELLETVPGINVNRNKVVYKPLFLIRGISSFRNSEVLMLLNGIPLNTYQNGDRGPLGYNLPLAMVERIEIMRGPGSALFGADAFAGVINIITKNAQTIEQSEVGLRLGSFDTAEAWLLHALEWQGFDVAIMIDALRTNGPNEIIAADLQTTLDEMNQTDYSYAPSPLRLGIDIYDLRLDVMRGNWQLRAAYQERRNVEPGVGPANNIDPVTVYKGGRSTVDLTYHNPYFTKNWDVKATLSYYHRDYGPTKNSYFYPPGALGEGPAIGNPGMSERQTRLALSTFYTGIKNHELRLGSGYRLSDIDKTTFSANYGLNPFTQQPLTPGGPLIDLTDTSRVFLPESVRKSWYVFLQDSWQFLPEWQLTTGLRYDHYSDFGSTLNPRLALVWQTTPRLTSKLLYGEAFRAPGLTELKVSDGLYIEGNDDLEPEKIRMLELAFNYQSSQELNWAWNFFTYEIKDKLVEILSGEETAALMFDNFGTQKGHGLEIETRWKATKKFSLLANYSWQSSQDQYHQALPFTPRHQAYLRTDWMITPSWYLDTQINWIAERPRAANDPRLEIGDYTKVDLTVHYKNPLYKNWHVKLGVRNLFNRQGWFPSRGPNERGIIIIPNDLPLIDRNYFLELRYRF